MNAPLRGTEVSPGTAREADLLTNFPLIHPGQAHLCRRHLAMVQAVSWAVQLHWRSLRKEVEVQSSSQIPFSLNYVSSGHPTCVMEPPGLAEEIRGGGSGIMSGLTAACRLLPSTGRLASAGWPACWNAGMRRHDVTESIRQWFLGPSEQTLLSESYL